MNEFERRLLHHASKQHHIFTRGEAGAAGLSQTAITRRVASGDFERLLPGVYRLTSLPVTEQMKMMAAIKWLGSNSVASHRSAGVLYALDGLRTAKPEVTTTELVKPSRRVVVHWTQGFHQSEISVKNGIPITTINRPLVDLGLVLDHAAYELAAESAIRQGYTSVAALQLYLSRFVSLQRPGSALVRRFVEARSLSQLSTESIQETRLLQRLRAAGLGEAERQWPVNLGGRNYRIDLAFPAHRIGIEYDSLERHMGRNAFLNDRARGNVLTGGGWQIFRATVDDLKRPGPLTAVIKARMGLNSQGHRAS